jgi:hypothetical protein
VQIEPPADTTMTRKWTHVLYKYQKPPAHQQSLKTADKIQYQHIPETTNLFDILTYSSNDLQNCRMTDGIMQNVGEFNSPRQRNFVHREKTNIGVVKCTKRIYIIKSQK